MDSKIVNPVWDGCGQKDHEVVYITSYVVYIHILLLWSLGPKCAVHLNFRGLTCAKAKIRDQKIKLISQGNGSSSVALVMPVQIMAQRTVHGTVILSRFILCL